MSLQEYLLTNLIEDAHDLIEDAHDPTLDEVMDRAGAGGTALLSNAAETVRRDRDAR